MITKYYANSLSAIMEAPKMRSDVYCGDTDLVNINHREEKRRESFRSITCISPRFIFSRLFSGNSRGARNDVGGKWDNQKLRGEFGIKRNCGVTKRSRDHDETSSYAAENTASNFNLGFGLGLIYLLAASKNELTKMFELHKQMEMMLQNLKTKSNQEIMLSKSTMAPFSSSNFQETLEENVFRKSLSFRGISFRSGEFRREKSLRMDRLEDELVAELDRLQIQMDTEFTVKYSNHKYSEINVEDSAPEMSLATSFEEITDQPESNDKDLFGICPIELEKRLYELSDSRLRERIDELELDLEHAMHQLEEKEKELSWWKDTARLMSQHAKESECKVVN